MTASDRDDGWLSAASLTGAILALRFVLESGWPVVAQEWAVLGLIGAMVLACGVFHRLWGTGPFERLLKKFTVTP